MKQIKILSLTVLFAAPAFAQTDGAIVLISSNTVSPSSPTTTVEVWATWNDPSKLFFFGITNYDLVAGEGEFVSGTLKLGFSPPNSIGVLTGRTVIGAHIGQLVLTCDPVFCPQDNPILLATYDWTTTDFTPRSVDLNTTKTTVFNVVTPGGIPGSGIVVELYPDDFTPGSGVINVVPAPATLLTLALPLVAACRRRRKE